MSNLHGINKKTLIKDFKDYISNPSNFNEEVKVNKFGQETNPKTFLYCDIETFRFNCLEGEIKSPRYFKNATWIVQVAWFEDNDKLPNWCYFKDFTEFLQVLTDYACEEVKHYDIQLVFHNGMKYDNHFLEKELITSIHLPLYNSISEKSINSKYHHLLHNNAIKKVPTFYNDRDSDWLAISAIRSSSSHALSFSYKGFFFETQDSYLKTNDPLEMVGHKCLEKRILTEEYIKDKGDIDFSDDKYNYASDLSDNEIEDYKDYLLNSLSPSEFKYVRNDVVVLAMCHKHFNELYYGFSWDEFTFSGNVKKSYEKKGYYSALTNFQLTKQTPKALVKYNSTRDNNNKIPKNLTLDDKEIAGWKSAEKFFRQFYRGGLNLYNEEYIGKIITPEKAGFSMDLNSSYPTVMYKEKLPTYLVEGSHFGKEKRIPKDLEYFYMYTVTPKTMDNLLKYVESRVIKQMFVKYYPVRNDGFVYINSVALNTLEQFMSKRIQDLRYIHCYKWKAEYFGARNVISDNYYIKQQGKSKVKFKEPWNPIDIVPTDTPNDDIKTPDEVQASKVLLNGIYGIPAMRPTFPQFIYEADGKPISMPEGHVNKERNVVFSVGVTAFAFRNLITPLTYLTAWEIDEYFWYCDTDSLYLDGAVRDKLVNEHSELFDKNNLGCWDLEHTNIVKFYPFNHKKYALYDLDDNSPLTVHAGGVSKRNVKAWISKSVEKHNDSMALDYLVGEYFHNGTTISNTRSIKNLYGTVAIYNGTSILQDGCHDGKKKKHYLNSYAEALELKNKREQFINENYDDIVKGFDKALSEVSMNNDMSLLVEFNIDGITEQVSMEEINNSYNFKDNINDERLFKGKVSKKDRIEMYDKLVSQDNGLIKLYTQYRQYIDYQNERLTVIGCDKLLNNKKYYFNNPYLAKKLSDNVYLTVDFRVIDKDTLKEYKIDIANYTIRFKKKQYYIFTEYVRLFLGYELKGQIENYLDDLTIKEYGVNPDIALYRDMYDNGKRFETRNPELKVYRDKKYLGYRLCDLTSIYFNNMDSRTRKKVNTYIHDHNNKKYYK